MWLTMPQPLPGNHSWLGWTGEVRSPGNESASSTTHGWSTAACSVRSGGPFCWCSWRPAGGVIGAEAYGGGLTLAMKALAPGVMVLGIIFFMGTISGAHLNPAVTLAFAVRGNFPWLRVPGYIVAQLAGAVLASMFLQGMYGNVIKGATEPAPGVKLWVAMLTEAVLTLGLVSVILGTASGARNVGINGALAIGGYIGLVSVWAAPVTGASMNPTRSFAPELVGGNLTDYWIYLAGPILGATVAVFFEFILRGRPTKAGADAAQGILTEENPSGL